MAGVSQCSTGVTVSYPAREQKHTVTNDEYEMVRSHPNRVMAIKFIRTQYGLELYEAKQVVDTICDSAEV